MKNIICMINLATEIGGIETLILRKAKWYIKNNFKVILLSTYKGEMHKVYEKEHVDVRYIYFPLNRKVSQFQLLSYINCFERQISEIRGNIKFIEAFNPITALIGEHLSAHLRIPCITGVFHPRAYYPGWEGGSDWRKLLESFNDRNALYFMNRECMLSHEQHYKINFADKIFPLLIESENNKYEVHKQRYNLLSIGRLVDFKTYNLTMVENIARLRKVIPDIHYTIIGNGPLRDEIIQRINKYDVQNNVTLLKHIDYDDIEKIIPEYDLHIGMGTSILDVGKYGMPSLIAISYDNSGATPGYLFDVPPYCVGECEANPENPSLEDAIQTFLLEGDRGLLSSRTMEYIQKYYDTNTLMQSFIDYAEKCDLPRELTIIEFKAPLPTKKEFIKYLLTKHIPAVISYFHALKALIKRKPNSV